MGSKLIRQGIPTRKDIASQKTKPIEEIWNMTTSFQNYQVTTAGMNLIPNMIEVISMTLMWFKKLLETLIANIRVKIPTM